ncbi:MAG: GNAT family N-acetyltransferase [gamma proteobacterium endosymbiont of Lamellibrachia anaximandri]|nr:GNAT family N-acetyltransferase [gamma proteobacterium endosymbiont of Lamellibrachia anaximandri]MBL3535625.1 GNAT family N-acetyltransferase [gamma proteobacterium endosymbiont of Lamellibrachia anaximandri]
MKIREAITEDAAGLKNCMASAYSTYQERMGGKRLPPMDVDYLSEIQNYPTWVVESKGVILGGLIMVFEEGEASIANIAVDPKSQGKGIGSSLMRFAESKAREKSFRELHLATHVLLNENISLYQHLGWKVSDRNETKVFMKKAI